MKKMKARLNILKVVSYDSIKREVCKILLMDFNSSFILMLIILILSYYRFSFIIITFFGLLFYSLIKFIY